MGTSLPRLTSVVDAAAGQLHVVHVAVRADGPSVGRQLRLVAGGAQSAPVTLEPWWQTVSVTATPATASLPVELVGEPAATTWRPGDAFVTSQVTAAAVAPTRSQVAGRQLLVDGKPYTMKGVAYLPAAIGGTPYTLGWNEPVRCQSDAQLLRAAGVNTLRIVFVPELYDQSSYRQCMDAMYGAGLRAIWLIQPPSGAQYNVDSPLFVEAYWQSLQRGMDAVKDHPFTLGWNIGNEINYLQPNSGGWWPQVDELARRAKAHDPLHVTTTTMSANQFLDPYFGGVNPKLAPNVDMWGLNIFAGKAGYGTKLWNSIATLDPTRPVWFSEYGVDRYRCENPDSNGLTCGPGSGEDEHMQAIWNAASWREIAAHLVPAAPGGVVGAMAFMWSDLWWFATGFAGVGTPVTRDVSGVYNGWSRDHQPDGHQSSEFYGITHAALPGSSGPRVTTEAYDALAALYTDKGGPVVAGVSAKVKGCTISVDFVSAAPVFGRVDWGPVSILSVAGATEADSAIMQNGVQSTVPGTRHHFDLTGLLPGTTYEVHARGFDGAGRPGSPNGVRVATPPTCA